MNELYLRAEILCPVHLLLIMGSEVWLVPTVTTWMEPSSQPAAR